MKQKLILFISLMLLMEMTAQAEIRMDKKPKEKVDLLVVKKSGVRRLGSSIFLEAYSDETTLDLFVEDYAGPAIVEIEGGGICGTVEIDETGYVAIDISQLAKGTYTLRITIGAIVFEGELEQ